MNEKNISREDLTQQKEKKRKEKPNREQRIGKQPEKKKKIPKLIILTTHAHFISYFPLLANFIDFHFGMQFMPTDTVMDRDP